ncbi:MAG: hypothetical protein EBU90_02505 [Proteobacteria bacterium]|nr:hypothetical protein [Pseudomonadota bacterium]NBP13107.1 hypothetical protein [bacterium]
MNPILFKTIEDYPQFNILIKHADTIKSEFINFRKNNVFISKDNKFKKAHRTTIDWIKQQNNDEQYYASGKNSDNWIVIPLYKNKFCFKTEFMQTNNLLRKIKNLNFSGFFCLKAGQSIPYHKHETNTAIIHINLFNLIDGRAFTYLDESKNGDPNTTDNYSTYIEKRFMVHERDFVIFNPFLYHCAKNKSKTDRITFAVEINL